MSVNSDSNNDEHALYNRRSTGITFRWCWGQSRSPLGDMRVLVMLAGLWMIGSVMLAVGIFVTINLSYAQAPPASYDKEPLKLAGMTQQDGLILLVFAVTLHLMLLIFFLVMLVVDREMAPRRNLVNSEDRTDSPITEKSDPPPCYEVVVLAETPPPTYHSLISRSESLDSVQLEAAQNVLPTLPLRTPEYQFMGVMQHLDDSRTSGFNESLHIETEETPLVIPNESDQMLTLEVRENDQRHSGTRSISDNLPVENDSLVNSQRVQEIHNTAVNRTSNLATRLIKIWDDRLVTARQVSARSSQSSLNSCHILSNSESLHRQSNHYANIRSNERNSSMYNKNLISRQVSESSSNNDTISSLTLPRCHTSCAKTNFSTCSSSELELPMSRESTLHSHDSGIQMNTFASTSNISSGSRSHSEMNHKNEHKIFYDSEQDSAIGSCVTVAEI